MSDYKIITVPDPVLKQVAQPVNKVDDAVRKQMDAMLQTMYDAPGIGLAANQVGMLNRVLVMDLSHRSERGHEDDEVEVVETPKPIFMANPEVIYESEEMSVMEEGCLSIPRQQAEVERPAIVRVKYLDYDGKEAELEAGGLLSHCVQHEIDHLNGVLFIDYLSTLKRNMILKRVQKLQKQNLLQWFKGAYMSQNSLKVIFMGTPDFAAVALQDLIDSGHEVVCAYSQPPRPKGRGHKVQKSPVNELAEKHDIPVYTPATLRNKEAQDEFAAHNADVAVVAAYGLLLPEAVLQAPKYGCLNIHASLLPRWRGASPIQHAIWKGDDKSGVTIMQMDKGLDTGDMILKGEIDITTQTTAASLHDDLATMGGKLALEVLAKLAENGTVDAEKQEDALSNYAPLLKKSDGLIDWQDHAADIYRQVRALNPWPGVWAEIQGKRFKVLEAQVLTVETSEVPATMLNKDGDVACGGCSILRIKILQPEGKKAMDFTAALNGGYVTVGQDAYRLCRNIGAEMTTRYKLTIEYRGTDYAGWQRQPDVPSIQQALEEAITKFCAQEVKTFVAGRTDAGVHARGQIVHVDFEPFKKPMDEYSILKAINAHLRPQPISVIGVEVVDEDFHARFSAVNKLYQYRIVNRPSFLTLDQGVVWLVNRNLDVEAMQEGAKHLLGHHDFSTFRDSECQAKSPVKTLDRLDISVRDYDLCGGKEIIIETEAQSFLHHQVRNMVGTLSLVGLGKWKPDDVKTALEAKDRTQGGPTAPADGLYLMRVDY